MSSRFGSKTDGGIIRDFIESYDGDAANYFAVNTAIVSEADKTAINTFYLGLKSDGIYTKIKAMYLPLWSSATNNKWNLKNPLDTNGAYRLTFSTGWTHSSSGMTPNGSSAFADTFLTTSVIGLNSGHLSYYSRTNSTVLGEEMGALQNLPNSYTDLIINYSGFGAGFRYNDNGSGTGTANANTQGFYIGSRTASNVIKLFKNGSTLLSLTSASGSTSSTRNIYIGAVNNQGTAQYFTNRQCSFASIGTGLTDTEAKNFSNRVNTLLAYFGINTYPVVSDADAQAYINANDAITSQSDANAINTFYLGLKTDGIYSKIKAMYLPIWSSASSNKWNLVNPLNTDAAYRLNFSTGWTHASSGITPDGISAYAETFFSTDKLNLNSIHGSHYSRTNVQSSGTSIGSRKSTTTASAFSLVLRSTTTGGTYRINDATATTFSLGNSDSRGFFIISRNASNSKRLFKNGTQLNSTTTASTGNNNLNIYIAALNQDGSPTLYDNHECAFSSLGDGLDTTEITALYNRVNTLMTYFGINV